MATLQPGLPPNTSVRQAPGSRDRLTDDPKVIRWMWWVQGIWKEFWRGVWAPFVSPGALFGFLATLVSLFFVFLVLGRDAVGARLLGGIAGGWSLLAAFPVWAGIQLVVAPFGRHRAHALEGGWQGSRYIFHQRKHLATFEWSPAHNDGCAVFDVEDAPADALIDYAIEVDGREDFIKCMLVGRYYFWPMQPLLELWRPALRGSVRLRSDRKLHLYCHSAPGNLPIIVRVYMLAWGIKPTAAFDYTDDRLGLRLAVSVPDVSNKHDDALPSSPTGGIGSSASEVAE